jgi:hypothetical protein
MGIKYVVNETFFDTWSTDMAYVLGYLYADGSLEDARGIRGKYVRVTSTDRDRIEVIRSLLESKHTIVRDVRGKNHKTRFLLRIGSHYLFDALLKIGITPHKSLIMPFPTIPREHFGSFVRGYFDGDGCAHIETTHGRPKRLLSVFTSGSKRFLESLHEKLCEEIAVTGRGLYKHGSTPGTYQLRYSTRDSLRLFNLMYPSGLKPSLRMQRKYAIFMRYLKLRDLSRSEISLVVQQKGPMVKR